MKESASLSLLKYIFYLMRWACLIKRRRGCEQLNEFEIGFDEWCKVIEPNDAR
jgi:hypothetical protein